MGASRRDEGLLDEACWRPASPRQRLFRGARLCSSPSMDLSLSEELRLAAEQTKDRDLVHSSLIGDSPRGRAAESMLRVHTRRGLEKFLTTDHGLNT